LVELTLELQKAYSIEHIAGHSDIAPGRKTDPGPCFDWERYRAALTAPR
jgi:AmpD protein